MKVKELLVEMYTAHVLYDEATRELLAEKFPPKYSKFIGHHVTVEFGVPADAEPPEDAEVKVLGIKDSGDGLEALVVSVGGETQRPDGGTYHITWSLEPDKYSPKDSNALMQDGTIKYKVSMPININTKPMLLK